MSAARRGALRPHAVELVALLTALAAITVLIWPVSVSVPTTTRAVPAPPPRPAAIARTDSLAAVLVNTNLFSGTRRAPRERFRLPGNEPVVDLAPAPLALGATDANEGPQLFGIVQLDGAPRALLQVASDSPPRLLAVGDRAGRWRVQRIGTDRVELQSASGSRTVRLSRRMSSDSTGSPP
jgi:hypothetical protein